MEVIRVEKTEEVMARINTYMPVHVPPEKVPPCFSDPWDYSGLCNPFKALPAPSDEHPNPRNCDLHRPCFVICMEGIGIKNAEQLEKENREAFFKFCEEKLSGVTPEPATVAPPEQEPADKERAEMQAQIDAAQPVEPPAETPPSTTVPANPPNLHSHEESPPATPEPPSAEPPAQASPQVGKLLEFQCEKCLSPFTVDPKAFDGILLCPDHREDVSPPVEVPPESTAPVEAAPEPAVETPPVEQPPAMDNPPKEPAQNEEVQAIPFRKSSAAWQIWIMLLEPKSGEELNELIKGKNFYYFKKFIPKVIEAAKEKGVLEEKEGKYQIVGTWDTTPGRRKKSAPKSAS